MRYSVLASHIRIAIGVSVAICFAISGNAAAPNYFLTTLAGYTPPVSNPIAIQQPQAAGFVAYNSTGVLYYAGNNHIWRLNANGTDTLIAGSYSAQAKFTEGQMAVDAPLIIYDFQIDSLNDIFIADQDAKKIYKVTPDGKIATFAGTGVYNSAVLPTVGTGVAATAVEIQPGALALDANNGLYASIVLPGSKKSPSGAIVFFSSDGASSQLINSMLEFFPQGHSMAVSGQYLFLMSGDFTIGSGPNANNGVEINLQTGAATILPSINNTAVAADPDGSVYWYRDGGVYKVDPASLVGQVAIPAPGLGTSAMSINPVTGDFALTNSDPPVIGPSADGNVAVLTAAGNYQPVACNAPAISGDNGPASVAVLGGTGALVSDSAGNLYFNNSLQIRKISHSGTITTIAGAANAQIYATAMALDQAGDLFFVNFNIDESLTIIQKIDPSGALTTVVGGGTLKLAAGITGTQAKISSRFLAVDQAGNLYFDGSLQVFKMNTSGEISLVAGSGTLGGIVSGYAATGAGIGVISSLAVDSSGVLYIGDGSHGMVLKVDSQGLIRIVAGAFGNTVDYPVKAGPALNVNLGSPLGIVVDSEGDVIFSDNSATLHPQILLVDPSGNLTPIAGSPTLTGSVGDGGDATLGSFTSVNALAIDASGNIYITDARTLIREMSLFNPRDPPPFVSFGGVVGAGGSFPAVQAVSPGALVSIFGANFVSAANQRTAGSSDLVNGALPTRLAGVCVNFGATPAALAGVYPSQINAQVGAVPLGAVNVQVTVNCGAPNAVVSNFSGVFVQTSSPEFFTFLPDPMGGHNPVAALNASTNASIGPVGLVPGATFEPAKPGDVIEVFATGLGATTPSYGVGVLPGAAGSISAPWALQLGGVAVPAANLVYAGVAPCCAGLYQVDFTVPQGTPSGNNALVITVAGVPSPQEAYLAVQ